MRSQPDDISMCCNPLCTQPTCWGCLDGTLWTESSPQISSSLGSVARISLVSRLYLAWEVEVYENQTTGSTYKEMIHTCITYCAKAPRQISGTPAWQACLAYLWTYPFLLSGHRCMRQLERSDVKSTGPTEAILQCAANRLWL